MIQALGLQHNLSVGIEGHEERAHKRDLFWTIYATEKMVSLRLGRSSTFRDQDITLSSFGMESPDGSFLAELAPGWINMASIQGRIYDDIYSPRALVQPSHVRTSRARALATELKTAMHHAQDTHVSLSLLPASHLSSSSRLHQQLTGRRIVIVRAKGISWVLITTK